MASRYDTEFLAGAWDALQDLHGETVTITPDTTASPSAIATAVTALWTPGRVIDGYFPDAKVQQAFGVVQVEVADVASWTPDTRDKVTIGGVVYAVVAIGERAPVAELQVVKFSATRFGGSPDFLTR